MGTIVVHRQASAHGSLQAWSILFVLALGFAACSSTDSASDVISADALTSEATGSTVAAATSLAAYRERARSDDAQSMEEAFAHGEARAAVVMQIKPNQLRVGGAEFRVKRNPVGDGAFVYDPRTRFSGVERYLIWWVPHENAVYPLSSPSKMVTPTLNWPREDGIHPPAPPVVIDYVFRGKPISVPEQHVPAPATTDSYTVQEYRIYRALIDTPMSVSQDEALNRVAERYGITLNQAEAVIDKVQNALAANRWFGSPESEIQHASDWSDQEP